MSHSSRDKERERERERQREKKRDEERERERELAFSSIALDAMNRVERYLSILSMVLDLKIEMMQKKKR